MESTLLPLDFIGKGTFNNGQGITATLYFNGTCHKFGPAGAFHGTIQTSDNTQLTKYSVSSNCPVTLETGITSKNSVKISFRNAIVYNINTRQKVIDCLIIYKAGQVTPNNWAGNITVLFPDGRKLIVQGIFFGSITVNRQVSGQREETCQNQK